jgi:hypothetical protein
MFVYDPARHRSYQLNTPAAANAGFRPCNDGKIPLYTDGTCVPPSHPYVDVTKVGSTFVHRNGTWTESCVSDKNGLKCCDPPNIPSPESGHCIKSDGPSVNELNLQVRTLDNGARYVAPEQSEAWTNALPAPAVYRNTVVPASATLRDMTQRLQNTTADYQVDGTKTYRQSAKRQRSSGRKRRFSQRRKSTRRRNTGRRDVPLVVNATAPIVRAPVTPAPVGPAPAGLAPVGLAPVGPAPAAAALVAPGSAPRPPAYNDLPLVPLNTPPRTPRAQAAYDQILDRAAAELFGSPNTLNLLPAELPLLAGDLFNNPGAPLNQNPIQWVPPRPVTGRIGTPRRVPQPEAEQAAALERQAAALERQAAERAVRRQQAQDFEQRRQAANRAVSDRRQLERQAAQREADELRERRQADRLAQLHRQADQANVDRQAAALLEHEAALERQAAARAAYERRQEERRAALERQTEDRAAYERRQAERRAELVRQVNEHREAEERREAASLQAFNERQAAARLAYEQAAALIIRPQGNRPPPAVPMDQLGLFTEPTAPAAPAALVAASPRSQQNSPQQQNSPRSGAGGSAPAAVPQLWPLEWNVREFLEKAKIVISNPRLQGLMLTDLGDVPDNIRALLLQFLAQGNGTFEQFIDRLRPILTPAENDMVTGHLQQQYLDLDERVDCSPYNQRRNLCRNHKPCVYEEPSGMCYNPRTYVQPDLSQRQRRAPDRLVERM